MNGVGKNQRTLRHERKGQKTEVKHMKMKKSTLIHLPLQYFAEPGAPADVVEGASPEDGGTPPAQPIFDEVL
jgi:hypothetical protein